MRGNVRASDGYTQQVTQQWPTQTLAQDDSTDNDAGADRKKRKGIEIECRSDPGNCHPTTPVTPNTSMVYSVPCNQRTPKPPRTTYIHPQGGGGCSHRAKSSTNERCPCCQPWRLYQTSNLFLPAESCVRVDSRWRRRWKGLGDEVKTSTAAAQFEWKGGLRLLTASNLPHVPQTRGKRQQHIRVGI